MSKVIAKCKTSTLMKANTASTSHSVNDSNTQPTIFEQLTVAHGYFHRYMFILATFMQRLK